MNKYNLVIVEDDDELATLTADFFEQFEFTCTIESLGKEAIKTITKQQPDVVLLDLMLPDMDGIQVFQQIKADYHGKVAMLTARGDTIDQVLGLEIGADDYISKPVEPRLLLAKVRALLRREESSEKSTDNNSVVKGQVAIDTRKRDVTFKGESIELSTFEYELLLLLIENSGEVVSRDVIYEALWGQDYDGQNRQVDIYISSIRAKLELDSSQPTLIKTVRSKGYVYVG